MASTTEAIKDLAQQFNALKEKQTRELETIIGLLDEIDSIEKLNVSTDIRPILTENISRVYSKIKELVAQKRDLSESMRKAAEVLIELTKQNDSNA